MQSEKFKETATNKHHWVFFHDDDDLSGPSKLARYVLGVKSAFKTETSEFGSRFLDATSEECIVPGRRGLGVEKYFLGSSTRPDLGIGDGVILSLINIGFACVY